MPPLSQILPKTDKIVFTWLQIEECSLEYYFKKLDIQRGFNENQFSTQFHNFYAHKTDSLCNKIRSICDKQNILISSKVFYLNFSGQCTGSLGSITVLEECKIERF